METALIVSSFALWIFSLFNLLLTLALIRKVNNLHTVGLNNAMSEPTLEPGEHAPNFTAQTLDGRTTTLEDYRNRVVAFIFVSVLCKPCKEKLPSLKELQPKAKQLGVELVVVSLDDKEKTWEFLEKMNLNLSVLIAPISENSFMDDYKVRGTPFYCRINREGKVQSAGFLDNWATALT